MNNSFLSVIGEKDKKGKLHLRPEFSTRGKDLMMKGSDFYAIYDGETGLWVTSQDEAIDIIDDRLYKYAKEHYDETSNGAFVTKDGEGKVTIDYLHISSTKQLKAFKDWLKNLPPNHNYHQLDAAITFIGTETSLKDYRTKRLGYSVEPGSMENYELFMNTCYDPEEREKLEWAVGSILCGDSVKLQKFIAVYGRPGTGKSTFFNIVQDLLDGYWSVIDVDALVSRNNAFGTAALKDNPLLCIQHDADLSRIEKNDVLNSIVSHEKIQINEKFSRQYTMKLNAMIFIGTNETVNISDMRQGITRRMIDVYPTGRVLDPATYDRVKEGFKFELGAIAYHCMQVYQTVDKEKYMKYRPTTMIQKTSVYTNFVSDRYLELTDPVNDPISATVLYKMFKEYMVESGYQYIPPISKFKEAMLDFYDDFKERDRVDGKQLRSVFIGFKKDIDNVLEYKSEGTPKGNDGNVRDRFGLNDILVGASIETNPLQMLLKDMPAQLSNRHGVPNVSWDECKTMLKDIDVFKEHYVKVPINLIIIDFDLKGADGKKDYLKNLEAIQKWPLTYAETSKSGAGIHLHYLYEGDASKLSPVYDEGIEVKVYTGNSALRRKLTKCNNLPIAKISSGLPLREEKPMVKFETLANERALRTVIIKNLKKEYHPGTKPSIDFIYKVLDDAYTSGMHYDVSDLESRIIAFAANSTNHADYCLKMVGKMRFQSDDVSDFVKSASEMMVFFDIEIFPNVFIVCWKEAGEGKPVNRMINPKPDAIENLFKYKLVGFNNRKYDNHMLWARSMGYTATGLYSLSRKLIYGDPKEQLAASFSEAYNLSYADVYDFAKTKQSLKKWEIQLGIHHLENQYPWDEDLPEDKWNEVTDYCCNDVLATEAVFNACKDDFIAREIIADLSGLTVNHTTRQHATRIIFGDDKNPELVYTDLSKTFPGYKFDKFGIDPSEYNGYDPEDKHTWHVGGKSIYMGEDPSEGGRVDVIPGIYYNVGLLDIASMHPSTIIALNLFGKYTKNFEDLVNLRLYIKHGDFDSARKMFNGKLAKWLEDESKEAIERLSNALKLVINSVYGFTSATFNNPFKDKRNVDNIVAKRGALFMIKLVNTLKEKGITVVHVKTDSIKIPNITPEIVAFVQDFGKQYGYTFEHESTYEKMCIVNGSTYIAKVSEGKHAGEWVAVAAQFQHPFVFKSLFTKEPLIFEDFCEVKEVKTNMVLDFNEGLDEGEHKYEYVGKVGSYVPVKAGFGGGVLLRDKGDLYKKQYEAWKENPYDKNGKPKPEPSRYVSVTGADGYRWLNSEVLKNNPNWRKMVDMSYYQKLAGDAKDAINEYGDFEQFMNYSSVVDFPADDENPYN